jgi:selenocysteine lyase/cysteine desulfurase
MTLFNKLKENNIVCSLREDHLRIAPHFYNTTEEINRLIELLFYNKK